jgi:hypothetical protein
LRFTDANAPRRQSFSRPFTTTAPRCATGGPHTYHIADHIAGHIAGSAASVRAPCTRADGLLAV